MNGLQALILLQTKKKFKIAKILDKSELPKNYFKDINFLSLTKNCGLDDEVQFHQNSNQRKVS